MGTVMSGKLLDTTVLIDLSRGNQIAADYVDNESKAGTPLSISMVSAMELVAGCRNNNEIAKAQKLLAKYSRIPLSPLISQRAFDLIVAYTKSHGLQIPDALIAATALVEALELMSDNDRHFRMIPNLTVSRPY
ncbi:type II toxin-antitoxin system VapC family toxin [candidate division KSB1 bacterium]|nr:type II toxin-antitoxin system VapC family toxin [candidate division KSB1 bacterium]